MSAVAQQRYLVTLSDACTPTDLTSPVDTSPRAGLSSRVVGASDSELTTGHSFLGPIRPDPRMDPTRGQLWSDCGVRGPGFESRR